MPLLGLQHGSGGLERLWRYDMALPGLYGLVILVFLAASLISNAKLLLGVRWNIKELVTIIVGEILINAVGTVFMLSVVGLI